MCGEWKCLCKPWLMLIISDNQSVSQSAPSDLCQSAQHIPESNCSLGLRSVSSQHVRLHCDNYVWWKAFVSSIGRLQQAGAQLHASIIITWFVRSSPNSTPQISKTQPFLPALCQQIPKTNRDATTIISTEDEIRNWDREDMARIPDMNKIK